MVLDFHEYSEAQLQITPATVGVGVEVTRENCSLRDTTTSSIKLFRILNGVDEHP